MTKAPLVHVLCAARSSVYSAIPGCDIYDAARSAWLCQPRRPIVAHPPCRFWSAWNCTASAQPGTILREMLLGVHCVRLVQRFGGVVEQPAHSRLFRLMGLLNDRLYTSGASPFVFLQVDQRHFGHRHAKPTWLFVSGCAGKKIPAMPLSFAVPSRHLLSSMTPGQRSATPLAFARWLVDTALLCKPSFLPPRPLH